VQCLANGEAVPNVVSVDGILLASASIDTRWIWRMQPSQLNGLDEIFLVTLDAYDVTYFTWLDVADIILEQLIA
jgi:hypothetical protein